MKSATGGRPFTDRFERRRSLFVTKNWRMTFRIHRDEIVDLDYEDYH